MLVKLIKSFIVNCSARQFSFKLHSLIILAVFSLFLTIIFKLFKIVFLLLINKQFATLYSLRPNCNELSSFLTILNTIESTLGTGKKLFFLTSKQAFILNIYFKYTLIPLKSFPSKLVNLK